MKDENSDRRTRGFERPAFGALVAFLLAPVVAQGLWRPLVHVFGLSGKASAVTAAALAISAALVVVQQLRPGRTPVLSLALGGLVASAAAAALALGLPGLLTLLVVAAAIAALLWWLPARLPPVLDGLAGRHKLLTAVYVLLSLASVASTARLSVFIGDPNQVDQQVMPGQKFIETHSCLTAYVRAATLSRQGVDNLYAERFWHGAHGLPPLPAGVENPYRPFLLDYYAYPPPFLFVMAPLAPLEGDFLAQRALWFGLNGLLLALGLWIVARWIDGPGAHRVLLLAPLFFGSLPVLATLQVGNFQIAVVVLSVLAMVAFERGHSASGGALLAFTILSKLSPGVLGVLLLAQRRWRSAAFAAGFGVLFLALSVLLFGTNPLQSFLTYTLPRISSGKAFAFMADDPFSILTNMSPFGLPFKLRLLGLDVGDPWILAPRIAHVYTLVLVALALLTLRRPGDRRTQALTWMSLLVLGALQSPFAPGYVVIGLLWAMTLLAVEARRLRGGIGLVFLWILINVVPPGRNMVVMTLYSIAQSAVGIGVSIWLIVRAPPAPASDSVA